jgi:triphosphoribosyl-dephospho-CoA synthase
MELALAEIDGLVACQGWTVSSRDVVWAATGPEALYSVDANADRLKRFTVEMEERRPIGRLWDLDVIAPSGSPLSRRALGQPPRRCLLCTRPAHECGRSRRHPLPLLLRTIRTLISEDLRSETARNVFPVISDFAYEALIAEVMLTPKPGLVDRRNSGAHRDMDMDTFLKSARVLSRYFPRFVRIGYDAATLTGKDFLPLVRPTGLLCEEEMFETTGGVNTHKGAIFALGLLTSACGRLLAKGIEFTRERICEEVGEICAGLVDRELGQQVTISTAGERLFRAYGLTGARGEAASGFRTVRCGALPAYDALREQGGSQNTALLEALLHLMAVNPDTNLVSRGGLAGLDYVRQHSRRLLLDGGALASDGLERIAAFDDDLIARNLSPGGSADLLIVLAFLARFPG